MITVYADMEALSHAAAELFVRESLRVVALRGRFVVLLAGGETPRRTYQILATTPLKDRVRWPSVHIFWGDERHVPAEDPRNNAHMARQELLDHVPIPAAQIHPIPYNSSPHESAIEYEHTLRTFFADGAPRFDLVFLGLGNNGHTASLFPGTPVLEEQQRWVAEVTVTEEAPSRITLTAPLINQAECVAFLVAGAGKAHILQQVLESSSDPRHVPACLIKPRGKLLWLVDRDAARLLGNTEHMCTDECHERELD